jgi:hypothetical protein
LLSEHLFKVHNGYGYRYASGCGWGRGRGCGHDRGHGRGYEWHVLQREKPSWHVWPVPPLDYCCDEPIMAVTTMQCAAMTGSVDLGVNRWLVEGGCQVPIVLEAVWVGVGLGQGGAC